MKTITRGSKPTHSRDSKRPDDPVPLRWAPILSTAPPLRQVHFPWEAPPDRETDTARRRSLDAAGRSESPGTSAPSAATTPVDVLVAELPASDVARPEAARRDGVPLALSCFAAGRSVVSFWGDLALTQTMPRARRTPATFTPHAALHTSPPGSTDSGSRAAVDAGTIVACRIVANGLDRSRAEDSDSLGHGIVVLTSGGQLTVFSDYDWSPPIAAAGHRSSAAPCESSVCLQLPDHGLGYSLEAEALHVVGQWVVVVQQRCVSMVNVAAWLYASDASGPEAKGLTRVPLRSDVERVMHVTTVHGKPEVWLETKRGSVVVVALEARLCDDVPDDDSSDDSDNVVRRSGIECSFAFRISTEVPHATRAVTDTLVGAFDADGHPALIKSVPQLCDAGPSVFSAPRAGYQSASRVDNTSSLSSVSMATVQPAKPPLPAARDRVYPRFVHRIQPDLSTRGCEMVAFVPPMLLRHPLERVPARVPAEHVTFVCSLSDCGTPGVLEPGAWRVLSWSELGGAEKRPITVNSPVAIGYGGGDSVQVVVAPMWPPRPTPPDPKQPPHDPPPLGSMAATVFGDGQALSAHRDGVAARHRDPHEPAEPPSIWRRMINVVTRKSETSPALSASAPSGDPLDNGSFVSPSTVPQHLSAHTSRTQSPYATPRSAADGTPRPARSPDMPFPAPGDIVSPESLVGSTPVSTVATARSVRSNPDRTYSEHSVLRLQARGRFMVTLAASDVAGIVTVPTHGLERTRPNTPFDPPTPKRHGRCVFLAWHKAQLFLVDGPLVPGPHK